MYVKYLECFSCKKRYPRSAIKYKCSCGKSLEIIYDYRRLKKSMSWKRLLKRPLNHWRYKEFFPFTKNTITLNEGGTALVRSKNKKRLFFKLESQNPTGSFKDRGSTVEISHAKDFKAKYVVCASTGNMGASVSAYSARAGLCCEIVLPHDAGGEKITQIRNYCARRTRVKGDYSQAEKLAYKKSRTKEQFLVGDYSFRGEGEKSVGFEIIDQMKHDYKNLPEYILCPIGNGTLISGIWKGLKEMKMAGLITKLPKLIGCQVKGCSVVVDAFNKKREIQIITPKTIAGAVACGDPLDGEKAVEALKESNGSGVLVSDKEVLEARREMSCSEGIDAEPSGCIAYAVYKKLNLRGDCVCIVTGHGLKDQNHFLTKGLK